jgi:hypothetical protein
MTARRVYLHIGEPKCGTTFLQETLWRRRAQLADHGVALPGIDVNDHYRAAQDLREIEQAPEDPGVRWVGAWDAVAKQARSANGIAVISHELILGADDGQAARAVESLAPAEVHVIVTARDLAGLLPAEWQETVKHRNARTWPEWLGDIIDTPPRRRRPRARWFWSAHDTVAVLNRWAALLPAEQIHLVTMPASSAPADLLWRRFAQVLGIDDIELGLSDARSNASLGVAEVELLRRLNERLPELPQWFYARQVKNRLAHGMLAERPKGERLAIPADRQSWVREQSARRIEQLAGLGVDVVGDLSELAAPDVFPSGTSPAQVSDAELLDVALYTLATTIDRRYQRTIQARWRPAATRSRLTALRFAHAVRRRRA